MTATVRVEADPPAPWFTRDVKFILLAQVVFGSGWSLYLLTPKFLATELHAGPETIGRIAATGGMAGLLTIPFAGYALDRLGRLLFFRCGAVLIALLSFGFMQVHELGPLLYVLQGCVTASFVLAFNAAAALLTDYAPPQQLGRVIGWLGGANVLTNAGSTMVAEPLAAQYGWHAVFALGIGCGCAAFLLSFVLREAPLEPRQAAALNAPSAPVAVPTVVAIMVSTVLMGATFIAIFSFIQPYALSQGAREVRGFFLGFSTAALLCRIFLGGLGDRLGRRLVSMWLFAGYGFSALLLLQLYADWLVLYGLVFGAAHGILYPTLNALVLEHMPSRRRGLGMVLYNGSFNLGATLGSLGWGTLAKHHGYPPMYGAALLAALLAIGILQLTQRPQA